MTNSLELSWIILFSSIGQFIIATLDYFIVTNPAKGRKALFYALGWIAILIYLASCCCVKFGQCFRITLHGIWLFPLSIYYSAWARNREKGENMQKSEWDNFVFETKSYGQTEQTENKIIRTQKWHEEIPDKFFTENTLNLIIENQPWELGDIGELFNKHHIDLCHGENGDTIYTVPIIVFKDSKNRVYAALLYDEDELGYTYEIQENFIYRKDEEIDTSWFMQYECPAGIMYISQIHEMYEWIESVHKSWYTEKTWDYYSRLPPIERKKRKEEILIDEMERQLENFSIYDPWHYPQFT